MQFSASRTRHFLLCQYAYREDVETESSKTTPAMSYGSLFHASMQILLQTGQFETEDSLLASHVNAAASSLMHFMTPTGNQWQKTFIIIGVEKPLATRVDEKGFAYSRDVEFNALNHTYSLQGEEFAGTYDVLLQSVEMPSFRLVLDFKTGDWGNYEAVEENPQLLTLALQTSSNAVAIMHTTPGLPPVIWAKELPITALEEHGRSLYAALQRRKEGYLRPSAKACKDCPARKGCPAKDSDLLSRGEHLLAQVVGNSAFLVLASSATPGAFHQFLSEVKRLDTRGREELKELVKEGGEHYRPDGKRLEIHIKHVERISKEGILKALGPEHGQAMLQNLRDLGCLEMKPQEELIAK